MTPITSRIAAVRAATLVSAAALAAAPIPTPVGAGPRFQPPAATHGICVPGLREGRFRAHVELFAQKRVVVVPRGIGLRDGCRARVRTLDPTGVLQFDRPGLTLGDLFAVWGRPLGARRLLGWRGRVTAFVGGRRVPGPVTEIPLRDRAQIVVEIGGYIPPHSTYLFPRR
jgi:hypothetical protein